jgi:hypothetical protein
MQIRPAVSELISLLECDTSTGVLIWKARPIDMFPGKRSLARCRSWNTRYAGKLAGHSCQHGKLKGYRVVRILYISYLVHHVVWAIVKGSWPSSLDHRLGKEFGDGIDNLRIANQSQNMQNSRKRNNNKSGFKGVSWDSINAKWVVRIRVPSGKYENLGRFSEASKGHDAYCQRASELYGSFARFN